MTSLVRVGLTVLLFSAGQLIITRLPFPLVNYAPAGADTEDTEDTEDYTVLIDPSSAEQVRIGADIYLYQLKPHTYSPFLSPCSILITSSGGIHSLSSVQSPYYAIGSP